MPAFTHQTPESLKRQQDAFCRCHSYRTVRGFTLIELIVVIVILGILSATAMPKFINMRKEARIATVKAMEGGIRSAIELARGAYHAKKDQLTEYSQQGRGNQVKIPTQNGEVTVHGQPNALYYTHLPGTLTNDAKGIGAMMGCQLFQTLSAVGAGAYAWYDCQGYRTILAKGDTFDEGGAAAFYPKGLISDAEAMSYSSSSFIPHQAMKGKNCYFSYNFGSGFQDFKTDFSDC